jgi:hypothetical protein
VGTSNPHDNDDAVAALAEAVRLLEVRLEARIGEAEERLGGQFQEVAAAVIDLIDPVDRLARVAHLRGERKALAVTGCASEPSPFAEPSAHHHLPEASAEHDASAPTEAVPERRRCWDRGFCRMAVCVVLTGVIVAGASYLVWGRDGDHFDDRGATLAIPPTASAPPSVGDLGTPTATPRRSQDRSDDPRPGPSASVSQGEPADQPQGVTGADQVSEAESTPRPSSPSSGSSSSESAPVVMAEDGDCDRRLLALRRTEVCRDRP